VNFVELGPSAQGVLATSVSDCVRQANEVAERVLLKGTTTEADPLLDSAHQLLNQAEQRVREVERWPRRSVSAEGDHFLLHEVPNIIGDLSRAIKEDEANGMLHHQRPARIWRQLCTWVPLLEIVAFIAMFAVFFNINLWGPQENPVGWLTVMGIPVVFITFQMWVASQTGHRYNQRRQAETEGRRQAAENLTTQARLWAGFTATITLAFAAVVTARMVDMNLVELGNWERMASIGVGLVFSVAIPVFKAGVIARDGSKISRQRDGLSELWTQEDDLRHQAVRRARLTDLGRVEEVLNKLLRILQDLTAVANQHHAQRIRPLSLLARMLGCDQRQLLVYAQVNIDRLPWTDPIWGPLHSRAQQTLDRTQRLDGLLQRLAQTQATWDSLNPERQGPSLVPRT
jgi:hypothetical protein